MKQTLGWIVAAAALCWIAYQGYQQDRADLINAIRELHQQVQSLQQEQQTFKQEHQALTTGK